ncbi:PEP-CTERM sorting domain-containing protein [Marinobacter salsuginis]|uniref:PEP-CTERM sorting domain-containing protein n=1 Tax=Marinobacter salsuginis TaxID=418719 RepID=UPI001C94EA97|nr:PEP-CTERM sorting domain-containing protein [Marinobacter salsuginis]MBY6072596.1 PEP-CTERM sorting domain-containing protein [Marinobacter salsuginis]
MRFNTSKIAAGSILAGLMLSASAHGAMISCNNDPTINYMQISDQQVSACLASGVGNINGNPNNLNNSLFISGVGSDYELASKSDGSNPYNISSTSDPNTWSFDSSFWNDYSEGALGFKFGTGNQPDEWFVFSLQSLVSSGEWAFIVGSDVRPTGGGLSHVNLYGKKGDITVPEPGTVALFGLGLVGLTIARRRSKTS